LWWQVVKGKDEEERKREKEGFFRESHVSAEILNPETWADGM